MKVISGCALACAVLILMSPFRVDAKVNTVKLTPAETQAATILRDVEAAMQGHQTVTAQFEMIGRGKTMSRGHFDLMRPNLVRVEYQSFLVGKTYDNLMLSDGKAYWLSPFPSSNDKTYFQGKLRHPNEVVIAFAGLVDFPVRVFFGVDEAVQRVRENDSGPVNNFKYIGERRWKDANYRVLQHDSVFGGKLKAHFTTQVFVAADNTVNRTILHLYSPTVRNPKRVRATTLEIRLSNIEFDVPLRREHFQWKRPEGFTQYHGELEKLMNEEE